MYGINLKYFYPFLSAIAASAVGALLITVFGVTSAGIGNGGILGVLSIQAQSPIKGVSTVVGTGFLWFGLTVAAVIVLAFVLTLGFGKIKYFQKFAPEFTAAEAAQNRTAKPGL